MADFILQSVRQTRTQALDLSGKNVRLSSLPPKNLSQRPLNTLGQKQYLAGEVREKTV